MQNIQLYKTITTHAHHAYRRPSIPSRAEEYHTAGLSPAERMCARFCENCISESFKLSVLLNKYKKSDLLDDVTLNGTSTVSVFTGRKIYVFSKRS